MCLQQVPLALSPIRVQRTLAHFRQRGGQEGIGAASRPGKSMAQNAISGQYTRSPRPQPPAGVTSKLRSWFKSRTSGLRPSRTLGVAQDGGPQINSSDWAVLEYNRYRARTAKWKSRLSNNRLEGFRAQTEIRVGASEHAPLALSIWRRLQGAVAGFSVRLVARDADVHPTPRA
jgi:hypothetical protein